jgi:aldehyde:ferredoxin oxidoreductase
MGNILRVDLSKGLMKEETPEEATLTKFVGGSGLGLKFLYDEVHPGVATALEICWQKG